MFQVCNFYTVYIGGIFLLPTVLDRALKEKIYAYFFMGTIHISPAIWSVNAL